MPTTPPIHTTCTAWQAYLSTNKQRIMQVVQARGNTQLAYFCSAVYSIPLYSILYSDTGMGIGMGEGIDDDAATATASTATAATATILLREALSFLWECLHLLHWRDTPSIDRELFGVVSGLLVLFQYVHLHNLHHIHLHEQRHNHKLHIQQHINQYIHHQDDQHNQYLRNRKRNRDDIEFDTDAAATACVPSATTTVDVAFAISGADLQALMRTADCGVLMGSERTAPLLGSLIDTLRASTSASSCASRPPSQPTPSPHSSRIPHIPPSLPHTPSPNWTLQRTRADICRQNMALLASHVGGGRGTRGGMGSRESDGMGRYIDCRKLDLVAFYNAHFTPSVPAVIPGCMGDWPAMLPEGGDGGAGRWSRLSYLLGVMGHRTVPVETGNTYLHPNAGSELLTLQAYCAKYIVGSTYLTNSTHSTYHSAYPDPPPMGYLAQHRLLDQVPDLRKDIFIPDFCALLGEEDEEEGGSASLSAGVNLSSIVGQQGQEGQQEQEQRGQEQQREKQEQEHEQLEQQQEKEQPESRAPDDVIVNAWLGPVGTVSPLHHDPYHNMLAQVVGYKYVRLYAPEQSCKLAPRPGRMSNNR
ncbi:hypothetical protein B484DRAFT_423051 [Ochromonadaceae sp. CCMP2298]|nr:hypothetical protein B484DRAFT_423051 [Ochromonadaceae sp. CCMP2298]